MAVDLSDERPSEFVPEVIEDSDAQDLSKFFAKRTDERYAVKKAALLTEHEAGEFTPLTWPVMDDGSREHPNAIGYPTGGWYLQQKGAALEDLSEDGQPPEGRESGAEENAREAAPAVVQAITPEEYEEIASKAHEEGYISGLELGKKQGYREGFEKGREEGLPQGREQGHEEGFAQGFAEGKNRGHEEGFMDGQKSGLKSGSDMVAAQVKRFASLADALANPVRQMNADVLDEIAFLVSRLCAVVLKREIKGDKAFLFDAVKNAVKTLPNYERGAVIYLNEEDLGLLQAMLGREFIKKHRWELKVKNTLMPGDVEAVNPVSQSDYKVKDRLDALLDEFLVNAHHLKEQTIKEPIEGSPDYSAAPRKIKGEVRLEDLAGEISEELVATAQSKQASEERIKEALKQEPEPLMPQWASEEELKLDIKEEPDQAAPAPKSQAPQRAPGPQAGTAPQAAPKPQVKSASAQVQRPAAPQNGAGAGPKPAAPQGAASANPQGKSVANPAAAFLSKGTPAKPQVRPAAPKGAPGQAQAQGPAQAQKSAQA